MMKFFTQSLRNSALLLMVTAIVPNINQPLSAQIIPKGIISPADGWSYADVADVFAPASIIARIRIKDTVVIKGEMSRPGTIRLYLTGDIVSLIRAPSALPPRVAWLVDVPLDARGKVPKLKKADFVLAAIPVPSPAGSVRLITRDAMVAWSPSVELRIRALTRELSAGDAIPPVTGVTSSFHTNGTVAGESETQIFLGASTGDTMSLNILRRPGETPRWTFAPGEIVDDAAAMPKVDTLTWYRLACFLPKTLPGAVTADLAVADAEAALVDYDLVIKGLGPCPRTRR